MTFELMTGIIGSLLLLRASIERTARGELAGMDGGTLPKSTHGAAAVLIAWEAKVTESGPARPFRVSHASRLRAQLQQPFDIRTGVCHGLAGASVADPGKPGTSTWEMNGHQQSITRDELQGVFRWLSKVPYAISMISRAAAELEPVRAASLLPGRTWWAAEYGIDLSSLI